MFDEIKQIHCQNLRFYWSQTSHTDSSNKEQLGEPALNLKVHLCGHEFQVLNDYDQKPFVIGERGLKCCVQTSFVVGEQGLKCCHQTSLLL
ncbi:hypothetical protein Tco_1377515 [Tanacetum coccineum]